MSCSTSIRGTHSFAILNISRDQLEFSLDDDKRLLIGIAGIPASGKTSLARMIVKGVNEVAAADAVRNLSKIGGDGEASRHLDIQ